jgi:hypothetical protein
MTRMATEKLVDKIERLKKRQGLMKRANQLIRKADREGIIRPTSADLKNAWLQFRTTRHDKTTEEQFASLVRA